MLTHRAAIAANRFGLGARPRDAESIGRDPIGWLEAQLDGASRAERTATRDPPASAGVLQAARDLRLARQLAERGRAELDPRGQTMPAEPPPIDLDVVRDFAQFVRGHYRDQAAGRHRRAIETETPFVERLVHFWSNHFAVSADKLGVGAIAGLYEQEAIRPHVTGNFLDLLTAAERHPAMLLYLDNAQSVGPNSTAANLARRRRGRELGLNENLAREILELHTLGVDGGYGQRDVTELAKVLTGWSIGGDLGRGAGGARVAVLARLADGGDPGEFHFRAGLHEPGAKTILGKEYRERGVDEGEAVLAALALHPATAKHLATKLARHFVADEPPAALVEQLAAAYLDARGELLPVYRALIRAEPSWREPLAKYKTPQDFVISAYRALEHTPENLEPLTAFLDQLGQRPLTPGSPAGWPDTAAHWASGDALLKRVEWAAAVGRAAGDRVDPVPLAEAVLGASLDEHTVQAIRGAESRSQAVGLLIAAPEFQRR
jgi:uncharacterized protein (DUF1800 family)